MGYKGHGHEGPETVYADKKRRGATPKRLGKRMKRRAAVESTIGHLKSEHRLETQPPQRRARKCAQRSPERCSDALRQVDGAVLRFLVRLLVVPKSESRAFPEAGWSVGHVFQE